MKSWSLRSGVACVLMAGAALATAQAADAPVSATWKDYEVNFTYSSFHTLYNCDALEGKLEQMLVSLGADKDVKVSTMGCFGDGNLGNMLTSRIKVKMPVPATSAEGTPASYKTVTLTNHRPGELIAGDCELLEQMRDRLLPELNLPVVKSTLRCVPGQASISVQELQIKALTMDSPKVATR